jgi:hypothetical protein
MNFRFKRSGVSIQQRDAEHECILSGAQAIPVSMGGTANPSGTLLGGGYHQILPTK